MARSPPMCMAMGSTLYELGSSFNINTSSSSSSSSSYGGVQISSSAWDPSSRSFSPPSRVASPFTGDVELLVCNVVYNCALGRSHPHVVMRKGSMLLICALHIGAQDVTVLLEAELPIEVQVNQPTSKWTSEGCWLIDGPIFLAQVGTKVILIRSSFGEAANASMDDEQSWDAQLLNFDQINKNNSMRVIYCGELELFTEPALLLSIHFSDDKEFDCMPCKNRLRLGWNFMRLSTDYAHVANMGVRCRSNSSWHEVEIENCVDICNNLFPPEICPDLISYMSIIPKDPVETVSYVASLAHSANDHHELLSHDVVLGFWNGRVVKYSSGVARAEADLKDASTSLQFAIVAGGQGVVVCTLNLGLSGIVILCAETFVTLKAWPGFQQAVVSDFQLIGHDQVLVLTFSSQRGRSSSNDDVSYFKPMHLTDLKDDFFSNLKQLCPLDSPAGASERHKIRNLDAIAQCLQSRLEIGFSLMKSLEEQRIQKAELVQSSCQLLQNMTIKHETPPKTTGLVSIADFMWKVIRTSVTKQGICGRTWFLLVNIENISPGDIVLDDLSLSFTIGRGRISGVSSVLKSLCSKDNGKRLIAAISLMDFPTTTTSILQIFVSLTVRKIDDVCKMHMQAKVKANNPMHKIWIGQIKLDDILAIDILDPRCVPLEFREVAVQHTLMIWKRSHDEYTDVINAIKGALRMEDRSDDSSMESTHELVGTQGAQWSDSTIIQVGEAFLVTLRAEDIKHLSVVKTCLVRRLRSKHYHITGAYPQMVEAFVGFLKVFRKELEYTRSLLEEGLDHGVLKAEGSTFADVRNEVYELQMSTDCEMGLLLGSIMNQLRPCSD